MGAMSICRGKYLVVSCGHVRSSLSQACDLVVSGLPDSFQPENRFPFEPFEVVNPRIGLVFSRFCPPKRPRRCPGPANHPQATHKPPPEPKTEAWQQTTWRKWTLRLRWGSQWEARRKLGAQRIVLSCLGFYGFLSWLSGRVSISPTKGIRGQRGFFSFPCPFLFGLWFATLGSYPFVT